MIVNDPFAGGTHLNDVTLVAPAFRDGVLVGWAANRAHHADLGGAAPGSIPADATEIQQEGLRIPPVRFTPEVRALLVASSRTPDERGGDIDAQVGANAVGVTRLAELADQPLTEVLAHGERRMVAETSLEARQLILPAFVREGISEPQPIETPPALGRGYTHEIAEVGRCLEAGLRESPLVPHAQTLAILRQMDDVRAQVGVRFA